MQGVLKYQKGILLRLLSAPYVAGFMDGCATVFHRRVELKFSQYNYRFVQLLGLIFSTAYPVKCTFEQHHQPR